MQSPSVQESLHSHTPEALSNPVMKVTQPNRGNDGWRETCRFSQHEEDEPACYLFNSEVFHEGSD
jgi:hypothetical protein